MSRFLAPPVVADHRSAPVNALGYLRVMFTVEDIDDTLARLGNAARSSSAKWSSTKTRIDSCYIRGPEGILIGLAQELGSRLPDEPCDRYRPVGVRTRGGYLPFEGV